MGLLTKKRIDELKEMAQDMLSPGGGSFSIVIYMEKGADQIHYNMIDGELYISRATVEQDMNLSGAASRLEIKTVEGREYFLATALPETSVRSIKIDEDRKNITLKIFNKYYSKN